MSGVDLDPLPAEAAWRHHTAREAVEVSTFTTGPTGARLRGVVTGVEDGAAFALTYDIEVDAAWRTRQARLRSLLPGDEATVLLERDDDGGWRVDGRPRPELGDAVDVDLEASAMTNTLPAHRVALDERTAGPAAYVRLDLSVERLEQWYGPSRPGADGGRLVAYEAPPFGADFDLTYDATGLVLHYPFLATRLR